MTKLKITVTKEILEKSKNCGHENKLISQSCAISLAVIDIFPNVSVGADSILDMSTGLYMELPEVAKKFIDSFDWANPEERVKMNPISFEIEIPNEVIEKINIDELRPLLVNHPTLELV
jgi:hypothetical protein